MPDSRLIDDSYKVAIVGSRESDEVDMVFKIVEKLRRTHDRLTVVSGGAKGIDGYARGACWNLGFHFCNAKPGEDGRMTYRHIDPPGPQHQKRPTHYVEFPVPPDDPGNPMSFGQRAYGRNITIIRAVDMVVAIYAPGKRTPGTTHAIKAGLQARKVVHVWHPAAGWVKYGTGEWPASGG